MGNGQDGVAGGGARRQRVVGKGTPAGQKDAASRTAGSGTRGEEHGTLRHQLHGWGQTPTPVLRAYTPSSRSTPCHTVL
jgi:hypothetical protein